MYIPNIIALILFIYFNMYDQIANIHWIIEKARKFQKNIYFCFLDYARWCGSQQTVKNSRDGKSRPPHLPPEKPVCRSRSNS